jgi:guanylate kinase
MNKFFILIGPGGVGKDTLLKEVIKTTPNLFELVTCTTRTLRPEDIPGITYNFFSEKEFKKMIKNNEFLEHDYHFGAYYGSRKKDLEVLLKKGNAIADIDINGTKNIKKIRPSIVTIFIKTKSKKELIKRLKNRGMSEDQIKAKLARYDEEMKYEKESDYVVVNDELKKAVEEIKLIIKKLGNY